MAKTFSIIDKVGGSIRAYALIEQSTGRSPSLGAITKWHETGRMPALIAQPLILDCSNRGIPVSLDDLTCEPKSKDPTKKRKFREEGAPA